MHSSDSGPSLWLHYKLIFVLGFQSIGKSILSKGRLLATLEHIHEGLAVIAARAEHLSAALCALCTLHPSWRFSTGSNSSQLGSPWQTLAQLGSRRCYGAPPPLLNKGAKRCITADTQLRKALSVFTELSLPALWETQASHGSSKII